MRLRHGAGRRGSFTAISHVSTYSYGVHTSHNPLRIQNTATSFKRCLIIIIYFKNELNIIVVLFIFVRCNFIELGLTRSFVCVYIDFVNLKFIYCPSEAVLVFWIKNAVCSLLYI